MSKLTPFDIEFFEIAQTLKKELDNETRKGLVKTLLKLNNPTYFYKHVKRNPIELHGYSTYRDWETDRKSTRLNSSHRL